MAGGIDDRLPVRPREASAWRGFLMLWCSKIVHQLPAILPPC